MRALVTGATSFVESNLVRSLLTAGHDVLADAAKKGATPPVSPCRQPVCG
jgi:uncharacterized protein YbjT (DUF2867 family)